MVRFNSHRSGWWKVILLTASLFLLFPVSSWSQQAMESLPVVPGFMVFEMNFEKGGQGAPVLPKSWRFVGVSNGGHQNSNILWFQDPAGNIYLLQGFTEGDTFITQSS